jgi:hypothetical protein
MCLRASNLPDQHATEPIPFSVYSFLSPYFQNPAFAGVLLVMVGDKSLGFDTYYVSRETFLTKTQNK